MMPHDDEYLDYIKKVTGSSSLCLAKWLNATIWLGSGQTTSCHHPPAHSIDIVELAKNPSALHNTARKKEDRRLMQEGKRPEGCSYCWKLEDINEVSDRVYKTKVHDKLLGNGGLAPTSPLQQAATSDFQDNVNLRTLEISFDRTCQFACSYCNPSFSTTWAKDIKQNGPYTDLQTSGAGTFSHEHNGAQPYKVGEPNPYVEAFWKWWDSGLAESLTELRVTGGEPTMSPDFWKLLDKYKEHYHAPLDEEISIGSDANPFFKKSNHVPALAVNTNLGCSEELFQKLMDASHDVPTFDLYTSCEATFEQAEYIRDGLDFDLWLARLDEINDHGGFYGVHVMCTINALSLFSLTKLLDMFLTMKEKYGRDAINFTLNILRFPSFQSALVLPEDIRKGCRQDLQMWLWKNLTNDFLHEHELRHVERLITYLNEPEFDDAAKQQHDFKSFYTQYDKRRGKSFENTFPERLTTWYKSL